MVKNIKKVMVALSLTILLSSSMGHAASFTRYNNYSNYNNYSRVRYVYNYNNYYENWFSNIFAQPTQNSWKYGETEKPKNAETTNETTEKEYTDTTNTNTNTNTNTTSASSIEMEVVNIVNSERQKAGLAPLQYSSELSNVARAKSQDMASKNYFSHTSPTYGDPFSMMKSFGIKYKTAGENIAKGYSSAQSVMKGWMNSSGHKANILNPSFGKIGVGYVNINGTTYWTQMFTD